MKIKDFCNITFSEHITVPFSTYWSEDDLVLSVTGKGVHIAGAWRNLRGAMIFLLFLTLPHIISADLTDITNAAFGNDRSLEPAAFGDFDSDEYMDLFVIKKSRKTLEILLGSDNEQKLLHREDRLHCDFNKKISSVVPGDFDGDAIMDILLTFETDESCKNGNELETIQDVTILWGGYALNCNDSKAITFKMCGQPLALDYNDDMIIDLFGLSIKGDRTYWVFNTARGKPKEIKMRSDNDKDEGLTVPHSHAFIDLNEDSNADLFLTTEIGFEVWNKSPIGFEFGRHIKLPFKRKILPDAIIGQAVMLDVELKGKISIVLPVCFDKYCKNSTIFILPSSYSTNWVDLKINFHYAGKLWGFVPPSGKSPYLSGITLRPGDYNMDGYPDLLATLQTDGNTKTFMLTNVACVLPNCIFERSFQVDWNAIPASSGTVLGVFFDFLQDGVLDIILVNDTLNGSPAKVIALKNSFDYDANFLKVMVLTGIKDKSTGTLHGPIERRNRTYGTNLPGAIVSYRSTNLDEKPRAAIAAQLPQSAYFSLNLPYTLFGLGRTANFIDYLTVGISGFNRTWSQLIPNSQMLVIPRPLNNPELWTARLFVTPSKLLLNSFIALLSICFLIIIIIGILYWKERCEDRSERLTEAHRFPYDGM